MYMDDVVVTLYLQYYKQEVDLMSTALLQVRVDEELKHRVDKKLKRMGLTTSSAVNLLLHRLTSRGKFLSRL
ncbi:type II toxin-antitoxin system RelB/DinJ family antitoxin [Mitsuokella multacida]|uniref:type II toxin-antitoxin system RelB/DinJ family antitoxin n=2 Tax=Mitsuokella multacida TaxID=52226 RepID=UPI003A4E5426